jgi:hypothetical protein
MTTTAVPKYSNELHSATERVLASHGLRCKPGIDTEKVLDTFAANGFAVAESHGFLEVSQTVAGNTAPCHISRLIEGLAAQRTELFYARDTQVGDAKCKDDLDQKGKIEYIQKHGLAKYEALPQKAGSEQVVVLDYRKMTRAQYLSLNRSQKAETLKSWPRGAVEQVMARTK